MNLLPEIEHEIKDDHQLNKIIKGMLAMMAMKKRRVPGVGGASGFQANADDHHEDFGCAGAPMKKAPKQRASRAPAQVCGTALKSGYLYKARDRWRDQWLPQSSRVLQATVRSIEYPLHRRN